VDIINNEHNEQMKLRKMSKETNTKKFFTLPKCLLKNDVNKNDKNSEDKKTTLSRCKHSSIIEELTK